MHEPGLALSLNNLGKSLSDLGRHEETPAAASRSVALYWQLTHSGLGHHEAGLALALSNLAGQPSGLGRFDEALAAAGESVQIHVRLAAADPGHTRLATGYWLIR